ncbi:unnamed protein product [Caenorhabditis bovis]|uniref:Uncharacterized protein n=1 Tax=Caenorhabditis bovis TaxID=2654633 RepID=A0A8S1F9M3_9PELO|nr:unnamed protein product [Caenorhabditis bovis]
MEDEPPASEHQSLDDIIESILDGESSRNNSSEVPLNEGIPINDNKENDIEQIAALVCEQDCCGALHEHMPESVLNDGTCCCAEFNERTYRGFLTWQDDLDPSEPRCICIEPLMDNSTRGFSVKKVSEFFERVKQNRGDICPSCRPRNGVDDADNDTRTPITRLRFLLCIGDIFNEGVQEVYPNGADYEQHLQANEYKDSDTDISDEDGCLN